MDLVRASPLLLVRIRHRYEETSVGESSGDLVAQGWRSRDSSNYAAFAVTIQPDAGSSTTSPLANGVNASRIDWTAAVHRCTSWPSSARLTGPISSAPCTAPSRP